MDTIKALNEIPPKEISVEFEYSIVVKGQKTKNVTMRKPKVGDMRRYSSKTGTDADKEVWLISALTGLSMSETDNLDSDQYELLQEALKKFQSSVIKSV